MHSAWDCTCLIRNDACYIADIVNACPDSSIISVGLIDLGKKNSINFVFNYRIPEDILISHNPEIHKSENVLLQLRCEPMHCTTKHCIMGGVIFGMQALRTKEIIIRLYYTLT